jgi:hypothetical protein
MVYEKDFYDPITLSPHKMIRKFGNKYPKCGQGEGFEKVASVHLDSNHLPLGPHLRLFFRVVRHAKNLTKYLFRETGTWVFLHKVLPGMTNTFLQSKQLGIN